MNHKSRAIVNFVGGVTGFIGGIAAIGNTVMQYKKDIIASQMKSEQFMKDAVKSKFRTVIPVVLGANPSIPNKKLDLHLESAISPTKLRSLSVVYGPPGVGKSTYLRDFAMRQIRGGRHAVVLVSVTSILELKNLLSIPVNSEISEFIPDGSIIILDQQENIQSSECTDIMYITLALEAWRTGKFHVFVCISKPVAAKRVLNLNGGEKITMVCPSVDLKADKDKLDTFIASRLTTMATDEREELRRLSHHTGVLGILVDAANELDGGNALGRQKMDIIKARTMGIAKSWDEFAAIDKNPYYKQA